MVGLIELVAGARAPTAGIWSDAALLAATFALGVPGGGGAAAILAAGAMFAVAAGGNQEMRGWPEMAGTDLALLTLAGSLRRVVVLALAVGTVVPPAVGGNGIEGWPVSLLVWAAAMLVAALAMTVVSAGMAARRPARVREGRWLALMLAAVAVLVALATGDGP